MHIAEDWKDYKIIATGDGYKLGYWAGASIQQYQCSQMHVMGGPGDTDSQNDSMGFTGPLLRINYNGERFMNEDTCAADAEYPIELQPKHKCFMITDSHFEENAAKCVNTFAATLAEWDERVGDGTIFKGQTLRELFESIDGMDVDAALATVERYNELCEKGVDDEMSTPYDPSWLHPVVKPPFYGAIIGSQMAKTMCGLRTDEHLQVMREDGSLIEGLYANATTAGGLSGEANYGCFWNSTVFGGVGTSWITGWIAAKSLLDAQ